MKHTNPDGSVVEVSIGRRASIGEGASILAKSDWIINLGADARGYTIHGCRVDGILRITAGCRNFTAAEALAHWSENQHFTLAVQMAMAIFAQPDTQPRSDPNS